MAERDMSSEIRQLREDFAALQNDVAEITALLRELGADRFEDAKSSTADTLREGREQFRRRVDAARARGQETIDEIGDTIGGHPLGSVAMAFGIGFLVAKLLEVGGRR